MTVDILYYALVLACLISTVGAPITIGTIWTVRTFLRKASFRELLCLITYWAVVVACYVAFTLFVVRVLAGC